MSFINFSGSYRWFGDQFQRVMGLAVDARMHLMGRRMVSRAKALAPVDTGRLRASIVYHYHPSIKQLLLVADAPYSIFQEFGTKFFLAHPYLRPAIEYGAKLWGAEGVVFGMAFFHTPRLKSRVAMAHNEGQRTNMAANFSTSRRFNQGPAGRAHQYIRSHRGGFRS